MGTHRIMGRTVGAMGLPPARKGETQQPQPPAARTCTPHAIKTSGQTRTDGKNTRYGDATAPQPYTAKRVHEIDNRIGTRYANRHFGTERIFEKGDRIGSIYKKYEQGAGFNDGQNELPPEMAIGGSLYAPLRSRMHPGRSDRRMVHLDRPDFDRRQPDTRKLGSELPAGSGLRHRFSVCRDPKPVSYTHLTLLFLDPVVGIGEVVTQPPGEPTADGGFSAPHVSDQKNDHILTPKINSTARYRRSPPPCRLSDVRFRTRRPYPRRSSFRAGDVYKRQNYICL